MPEGHTVHRQARELRGRFRGQVVAASSPQGRFEAGAALLDGQAMRAVEAFGKHLFLQVESRVWLHVHLGLAGVWTFGDGPAPTPRGSVRLRLVGGGHWADLRGPVICEVITGPQRRAIHDRLGADPLRRDADPDRAGRLVLRSKVSIGGLLMRQDVVAGIGNVYRAEALFRQRIDPWAAGSSLTPQVWQALWCDLVVLLRDGLRRGRIVTTDVQHRSRRSGTVLAQDAHYVYRRTGLACRVCATTVLAEPMAGRTLYRCPACQRVGSLLA
jgi:formamidopyrimidine-DNA glycosylase